MSLLMEALRKAEEAKRRMQQEEQAAAGRDFRDTASSPRETSSFRNAPSAFTLEEREPEVTPEYIRDNFTSPQDSPVAASTQDDYTAADDQNSAPEPEPQHASQAPLTPTPAVARREQRAAAASVFAAKQGPARNRKALTILVVVMVLMIPIGGGVLWYLQSASTSGIGLQPALANYDLSSRQLAAENSTPAATPTEPATSAQTAVTETAVQTETAAQLATAEEATAPAAATEAAPVDESTVATGAEPDVETQIAATESTTVPAVTAPLPAATPTTPVVPPVSPGPAIVAANTAPAAPSTSVMEITRSRSSNQVNPDLVIAYESLQSGDLPTARRLYQQLLNVLPTNRDAMLGLASINLREGNQTGARALYARLLQLNPRDALAHTGLLQTMQASDPNEHERALKTLIAAYPDVAPLTLALGNHYASQQRWSEAQGAYYNALLTASRSTGGPPVHPDYAFNLAVSLEQLNEPRAALDYYRRAQALAAEVTPGFDRQLLNSRLAYLEQAQP